MAVNTSTSAVDILFVTNNSVVSVNDIGTTSQGGSGQTIDITFFEVCVMVIGVIGIVANGAVLSTLLNRKLRSRANNLLILNQVSLDLYSSVLLVITFSVQMGVQTFFQPSSSAICKLFFGEFFLFVGVHASITSLVLIMLERYVKIVYHVYHRKYYKKWMTTVAMVICWVIGFLNTFTTVLTHTVSDGNCNYTQDFFGSAQLATIYSVQLTIWHYVVPILIFILSYVHIFITVRRSSQIGHGGMAAVVPGTSNDGGSGAPHMSKTQICIVKTCMIVSLTFTTCWFLSNCVYFISVISLQVIEDNFGLSFISTFIGFFNMCVNPFIYALSLDGVKKQLISTYCHRQQELEPESVVTSRKTGSSS